MKTILLIVISSLILSSCASVFSPSSQDITIFTKNKDTKVYVNDKFIAQADSLVTEVDKDAESKQLRFETDSCKAEYRILIQDSKSKLYILSVIPFGILIYPMMYDFAAKTWVYEDEFILDTITKYNYWNPDKKRILLRNVSVDIKKEDHIYNGYSYSYYLDDDEPSTTENMDSVKYGNSVFEDRLEEVLKTTHYIDTTNTVFIDNVNTLTLRCVLKKLVFNEVWRRYNGWSISRFANAEITADWIFEDIYGDTLLNKSFSGKSGDFSIGHYKVDQASKNAINDALEECLVNFFNDATVNEFIIRDTVKHVQFDNLVINKPAKIPVNIEDAMQATVTIKNDDGHGSGFLISNDGYIITNHHVVSKDKKYTVIMGDGKEYELAVIRSNKVLDLAIAKIDGEFDFAFPIPEEKNFKTGQEIFAIGTPKSIELGQSLSKGIVSALRTNDDLHYIQTDVSVNRGNSGGAVITSDGNLIGVVEYKLLGIGTEGISFAIPAYDIMKSLSISY